MLSTDWGGLQGIMSNEHLHYYFNENNIVTVSFVVIGQYLSGCNKYHLMFKSFPNVIFDEPKKVNNGHNLT